MVGTYHVVCHECSFEGLFDDRTTAKRKRDTHEAECGHQMSLLDISVPETPAAPQ
ncbi:MAG: hypothetical protein ABEH86_13235 [Haloarcula sp.]